MSKDLRPFVRGILGIPYGERIMPNYIFADKDLRGTVTIEYREEKRGEKWWYERFVRITSSQSTDEIHSQWFGSYDSHEECMERISKAKEMDVTFSQL